MASDSRNHRLKMLPVLPFYRKPFSIEFACAKDRRERKRGENKFIQNQISWKVAYAYRAVELYED